MKLLMNKALAILALTTALTLSMFVFSPHSYAVDCSSGSLTTQQAIQCGTNGASGNNQSPGQAGKNIDSTIANIVNLLSTIVGVIAVIMIIVGGFRYITSGGKQESVSGAKNTILYAIIGLIVVATARIIVKFVLNKST
jgi:hypothetical protein